MKVLVIFPKPQCYTLKDMAIQRTYREKFLKYIKLLSDNGCSLEVLLEDQLAYDMLQMVGVKPYMVSTCITKSDLDWIEKYPDIEDLSQRVFGDYASANKVLYDADSKFIVPLTMMKEGKAAYYKARVLAYHKRYRYTIDRYVTDSINVLQFRLDGPMDRSVAVRNTVRDGDGRLCIEVGLNTGFVQSYYGGVFVQEEYLPTILSL